MSTPKHWSVILIRKFYHLWLSRRSCQIIELENIKNLINSKKYLPLWNLVVILITICAICAPHFFYFDRMVWSWRIIQAVNTKTLICHSHQMFYHLGLSRRPCHIIELENVKSLINSKNIFVFVKFGGDFEYCLQVQGFIQIYLIFKAFFWTNQKF